MPHPLTDCGGPHMQPCDLQGHAHIIGLLRSPSPD